MGNSRKIEFDIMKGIAILLVMLGHSNIFYGDCQMPDVFNRIIFSFHVPLFFFVAGYFSKPFTDAYLPTVKGYAKRLVLPYVITMLVVVAYCALLAWKRDDWNLLIETLLTYLIDPSGKFLNMFGCSASGAGPAWFLMALFWSKTIFLFVSKYEKWALCIGIAISCIGSLLSPLFPLPFDLWQGINAVGFVSLGYWCKLHKIQVWMKVLSILCWFICLGYVGMDPFSAHYPIYPLNLLGAGGATLLVYWLSYGLSKVSVFAKVFSSLGSNSMNILCAHTMDMKCNAIRIILKQVPAFVEYKWLALSLDYLITIAASYLPLLFKKIRK